MKNTLKLTLLENSRSFLSEALRNALIAERDTHQWKFAIFNICQAIEISLKERLRREHPALILENIDKGTKTVTPAMALTRLYKFCDVSVDNGDIKVIQSAIKWRNEIIHSEFSLNVVELKSAFSVLLGFILSFHEQVLKEPLSSQLPNKELWSEALRIQEYGQAVFSRASQQIQAEGIDINNIIFCPRCGRKACVLREDTCRCYVCGSEEDLVECESCQDLAPVSHTEQSWTGMSEDEMSEVRICRKCIDSAEDRYIQHMIDLDRGK